MINIPPDSRLVVSEKKQCLACSLCSDTCCKAPTVLCSPDCCSGPQLHPVLLTPPSASLWCGSISKCFLFSYRPRLSWPLSHVAPFKCCSSGQVVVLVLAHQSQWMMHWLTHHLETEWTCHVGWYFNHVLCHTVLWVCVCVCICACVCVCSSSVQAKQTPAWKQVSELA